MEHNLNIRDAEIDIDWNYCVNCHPLSSGRAILSKSPETKIGYRSVQNCKQMHNKYAIYCHICKEPELHNELKSPHDLIRKYRNGTLKPLSTRYGANIELLYAAPNANTTSKTT